MLKIISQLVQLFSLALKNTVHDAFNLCRYCHRLRFLAGSNWLAFPFGPRSPKDLFGCCCRCCFWLLLYAFLRWHILNLRARYVGSNGSKTQHRRRLCGIAHVQANLGPLVRAELLADYLLFQLPLAERVSKYLVRSPRHSNRPKLSFFPLQS